MTRGNDFRRDQRQNQRTQNTFAQRRFDAFRREQEAQRRMAGPGRAEQERRAREAEEEARRREEAAARERERLERERELREEMRRRQEAQLRGEQRRARREANEANALRNRQAEDAARLRRAQRLAAEGLISRQSDRISELHPPLTAALTALTQRVPPLRRRLSALLAALTGGGGAADHADRAGLAAADALMNQILQRSRAALADVPVQLLQLRQARGAAADLRTTQTLALFTGYEAQAAQDGPLVTQADQAATLAEQTHQQTLTARRTYPNLNLTYDEVAQARGVMTLLTATQRAALDAKLQGHSVTGWIEDKIPSTRSGTVLNVGARIRMPAGLAYWPACRPSAEIFCDWIVPRDGHGQSAADMKRILQPTGNMATMVTFVETPQLDGKIVVTASNLTLRIVYNADKSLLITFYHKP